MAGNFDKYFEIGEHLAKTGASKEVIVDVLRDKGCNYFMTLRVLSKLKKSYKVSVSSNLKMQRVVYASRFLLVAIIIVVTLLWFNYAGKVLSAFIPLIIGYGIIWATYTLFIWLFLNMYPSKGYRTKPTGLTHILFGLAVTIISVALWNSWIILAVILLAIVTFMLLISIYSVGTAEAVLLTIMLGFLNLIFKWLMPKFVEHFTSII